MTYWQLMRTRQEAIDDLYAYTDSAAAMSGIPDDGYLPTLLREAAVLLERDEAQIRALEDLPLES